jgi:branched-chain amino acid transport system substrate-binding protein
VILKNAKELGMIPGVTVGLAHASFTQALTDLAGASLVEGVYGVLLTVTWDDNAPGIAKAKEYVQKNHAKDANNMDYLTSWTTSLVTLEILKLAVKNAGYDKPGQGRRRCLEIDRKAGIQKLNGYKVEGLHGPVTYTPGTIARQIQDLYCQERQNYTLSDWIEAPMIKYEDYSWWGSNKSWYR